MLQRLTRVLPAFIEAAFNNHALVYANSTIPAARTATLSKLTVREHPSEAANCAIKTSTKPALVD